MKLIPVLAIDGPSGAGKGTVARAIARRLNWHILDSGALYRLVGLAAARRQIMLDDEAALGQLAATMDVRFEAMADGSQTVFLDENDVTLTIRDEIAGNNASKVAVLPAVREALVELQRGFRTPPGLVADGRDMGTEIFPDAGLKVFLTASAEERAKRRHKQLKEQGIDVSLSALCSDIAERDRRDARRETAPLKPAPDARVLDTTYLSTAQVVERLEQMVRSEFNLDF